MVRGVNGTNGTDGSDGSDGSTIQIVYLYYRKTTSTAPSTPSYSGGTVPSGWSTTPKGTTSTYKYEFISQCTVTNGSYGSWSTPVLWAKYGVDGSDGSDANVNYTNVFNALTNNGSTHGCFTGVNGELYINAAYIQAGEINSEITFTGKMIADDAEITGNIVATSGAIGGWVIEDGVIHSSQGVYGAYSYTTTGTDLRTVYGYAFTSLDPTGITYIIRSANSWSSSISAIINNSIGSSSGGSSSGGVTPL